MEKMAYLTSLAYPESSGGSGPGYLTPLISYLTVGNVYSKQPCLVKSISHTIESDVSWDIDVQVPMSILVSMQVRLLDKELYTYEGMKEGDNVFKLYLQSESPYEQSEANQALGAIQKALPFLTG